MIGSLDTNLHILETVVFTKSMKIDANEYYWIHSILLNLINLIYKSTAVTSPFYQKCTATIEFNYPDISSFNQTDTSTILKLFKFCINSACMRVLVQTSWALMATARSSVNNSTLCSPSRKETQKILVSESRKKLSVPSYK